MLYDEMFPHGLGRSRRGTTPVRDKPQYSGGWPDAAVINVCSGGNNMPADAL